MTFKQNLIILKLLSQLKLKQAYKLLGFHFLAQDRTENNMHT